MIDRLLLACVVVIYALLAVWSWDASRIKSQRDQARAELSRVRASVAEQRATFEADARARETLMRAEMDAIADQYRKEMQDAQDEHDRTVADLESGNRRLLAHWRGCEATAELSRDAEAAARADEAARLRAEGAADLVRLGAQCDAQVSGLQRIVRVITGEDDVRR